MNQITPFTLSFLKLHTQSAANVLERLPIEDSVDFLGEIPIDLAAKTIETMAPQYAAQCFLMFSAEKCSQLIQEMKTASGVSLLRFMPGTVTQTILKQLLPEKKELVKNRLDYPLELVGAWMDSDNPGLLPDTLVGEIRKSIRISKKEIECAPCVVGPDGTVIGILSQAKLISAKDSNSVSSIMERDFKTISERTTIHWAHSQSDWKNFDALPVVDRKQKFVGMLTLKNLNKALVIVKGDSSEKGMDSVLMDGICLCFDFVMACSIRGIPF